MPSPMVIMIVDDDPDDIALFCEALSEIDSTIECRYAHGGEEAMEILQDRKTPQPDYIFLDLNMPRMNGKQCLMKIKADVTLSSIPVIIYSTTKNKEDVVETKGLGAIHFITKPNKFNDLKKEIRYVLEAKKEQNPNID